MTYKKIKKKTNHLPEAVSQGQLSYRLKKHLERFSRQETLRTLAQSHLRFLHLDMACHFLSSLSRSPEKVNENHISWSIYIKHTNKVPKQLKYGAN